MKLGLLADIHEDVAHLKTALGTFQQERVDQVVVLGDLFERGLAIRETCRLLKEANAVGVWGNHDFGLSSAPDEGMLRRYGPEVLEFMGTLQPTLELAGCFFHHIEPWLDANDVMDLWYMEGPPNTPEKVARIFSAVPNHLIVAGHCHRWWLVTPEGIRDWNGREPLDLSDGRYFVVLGAVCDGKYAVLDTQTFRLTPFNEG